MSLAAPEQDEITDLSELEEFEIPCDGPKIWPERLGLHDDPARWVALKPCGHHRLLCDHCKEAYLQMIAEDGPAFVCWDCVALGAHGAHDRHFLGFELLSKS